MNIIEKGNIIEQVFNTVNAATVAIKEKAKVEEEKLDDIQVVEIKGVRYLTSAILAERYGTTPKRIANNFNENYDIGQLLGRSLESVEGRLHRLRKAGRL